MENQEMRLAALSAEARKLARLREQFAAADTILKARQKEFADRTADQMTEVKSLKGKVAEQEDAVRDLAEAVHDFHPDVKVPAPGIGFRKKTVVEYDPVEAIAWAIKEDAQGMLKLDAGKFETVAAAMKFDWVEISEKSAATVSKDLSEKYPPSDAVQEIALPKTQPVERTEGAEEDPWESK